MAEKTSITALLIDANGFEKRVTIPYKEGFPPLPVIAVMDYRSISKVMRRVAFEPPGVSAPMGLYQLHFRFASKWRYEGTGENTKSFPVYEEVIP